MNDGTCYECEPYTHKENDRSCMFGFCNDEEILLKNGKCTLCDKNERKIDDYTCKKDLCKDH